MEIYSDSKFLSLQKQVMKDLKLTRDNVNDKLLEMAVIYTKYRKLYYDQKTVLKNIDLEIKKTKKKRYHYYKFGEDFEFRLDNATERMIYVDGDEELCDLYLLYDKQESIVDFLKDTMSQINKMSYLIRSYVDLEKMRNGIL